MKSIKRDFSYLADRERRWLHGAGILVALVACTAFWAAVYVAIYYYTLDG